jgi:hypothetical protein
MSVSKALSQHITNVVLLKGKTSFQLPLISSYIKVINLSTGKPSAQLIDMHDKLYRSVIYAIKGFIFRYLSRKLNVALANKKFA